MRRLLLLCCLVACGHADPVGPPEVTPQPPADIHGHWTGDVGQPVVLELAWGMNGSEGCCGVFVAGGYGTIGPDSVHVTGYLHADTLAVSTSLVYGANQPHVTFRALARGDTLAGDWNGRPVRLVRH